MGEPEQEAARRPQRLSLPVVGIREKRRLEGLNFESVSVDVSEKRILWDVSGYAAPGHVLAVMGPSGSGKTTLLNTLAGHTPMTSGAVTLNGRRMSKKIKRTISYVLQADIFFANLTLRETLQYSALLRLPSELSLKERLQKVQNVIEMLRLQECATTLIGDVRVRGLSGGEKKRANIACELLTSPTLLLLDEPTSGLDSSSALSLLQILTSLARDHNKTVVTSIHQPSSQMYHMFDGLLLLAKGKVAYFGPAADAVTYFASLGLHCTLHYNPADYMVELVTDNETRKVLIGSDPKQEERPQLLWWQRCLLRLGFKRVGRRVTRPTEEDPEKEEEEPDMEILEYACSPRVLRKPPPSATNPMMIMDSKDSSLDPTPEPEAVPTKTKGKTKKWPTPWYWQFLVLVVRTFRQSRHVMLSKISFVQTLLVAVVCSLVWFQLPMEEDSISDRYGLLFFMTIFWAFSPGIVALTSFPAERTVISKERASGSYHLSAYYFAKTLSELPLLFMQPSLFIIIVYWSAGLNGPAAFFATWALLLLSGFTAQSLGLMISALIMDTAKATVILVVVMLSSLMLAGFYVQNLPPWLDWAQYISFVNYGFDGMLRIEFTSDQHYRCNTEASEYVACNATYVGNATIPGTAVLEKLGVTFPMYANIVALIGFAVLFRSIAYLSLRFLHRR